MKEKIKIGLCAVIFSALVGCKNNKPEVAQVDEPFCLSEKFLEKIEIETIHKKPITSGIHLTGVVESNPDRVVQFVSLIGGIISKTSFSLGDEVQQGQVLAEMRSTELSSLQQEISTIHSKIQVAQKQLESVQSMYEDGIISERELLEAQTELEILKAEERKTKTNLNLFSASPERGVFKIKAPTSGIVTSKSIAAGTQISSDSDPLFTISDLKEVWVMVNIYATNVQAVQTGMEVQIKTLSYPDEVFTGKIGSISSVLDSDAKVLKARITLDNKDFKLKPGMLVDVTALQKQEGEALAIPTNSLVFEDNKNYIVVYEDECNFRKLPVKIISSDNGTTFIESGLSENDKIITKNQLLIFEQLKNN